MEGNGKYKLNLPRSLSQCFAYALGNPRKKKNPSYSCFLFLIPPQLVPTLFFHPAHSHFSSKNPLLLLPLQASTSSTAYCSTKKGLYLNHHHGKVVMSLPHVPCSSEHLWKSSSTPPNEMPSSLSDG